MLPSAYDIREYYLCPQGRAVRAAIARVLGESWPGEGLDGGVVAGAGYAIPYLEDLCGDGVTNFVLLPGSMGAMPWPDAGGDAAAGRSVLAPRGQWPLSGASVDLVIMTHELEYSEDPALVLDEAWRVLKPEGRLLLVVPNRTAPWARSERNPFGHGRPFSSSQVYGLLRERDFTLERMTGALLAPPLASATYNARILPVIEHLAPYCTALCGVMVIDARKRLFSPISGKPKPVAAKAGIAWAPAG